MRGVSVCGEHRLSILSIFSLVIGGFWSLSDVSFTTGMIYRHLGWSGTDFWNSKLNLDEGIMRCF